TAGFLGFSRLEVLTHAGENLLSLLRDGKLQLDSAMTSALLSMVDHIRGLLAVIERTGSDAEGDAQAIEALTATLAALADPDAAPAPAAEAGPAAAAADETAVEEAAGDAAHHDEDHEDHDD